MINITEKIYSKVKSIMDTWSEADIYAISFFVYSNESYEYKEFSNVSSLAISYNTESDCEGADLYDEERWNYAFWRQDETSIIDIDEPDECTEALYKWYAEQGIENITDDTEIRNTIKTIIENNPESVADYKNGHDRAIKYLMGQVMKETKGKANPKMAMDILTEELQ